MQIAHERAPEGFKHVHDVISEEELNTIALRYKRVAGFDPSMLASKARNDHHPYFPRARIFGDFGG